MAPMALSTAQTTATRVISRRGYIGPAIALSRVRELEKRPSGYGRHIVEAASSTDREVERRVKKIMDQCDGIQARVRELDLQEPARSFPYVRRFVRWLCK